MNVDSGGVKTELVAIIIALKRIHENVGLLREYY